MLKPLQELDFQRFDEPRILKQLARASRRLGQLNGGIQVIPNEAILINTLALQEAKDSTEIENIVTTHDEIYRGQLELEFDRSPAAKEVQRYRYALEVGAQLVGSTGLITINHLCEIQAELIKSEAGIRTMPGTVLRNSYGETVYTPPQEHQVVIEQLRLLEEFINQSEHIEIDPLIKMALIHHQFESIHPFYDGNGRTGRILNVIYLMKENLLDIPVLYLSRPLMKFKSAYYEQLQSVRDHDTWENWVFFMLQAVESSALDALITVENIRSALQRTKQTIRNQHKFYSQDLINLLFSHPYTKIDHVMRSLDVSRITATKYLEALTDSGVLKKVKVGRSNYYVNESLWQILVGEPTPSERTNK